MFGRKKTDVPTPEEALPGRPETVEIPDRHFVNGHPLEGPWPEGVETAVFGMGCFWGAERLFWQADGVYSTAVGYAGGSTPNPTYRETCTGRTGHTEVVLVAFDPTKISFERLTGIFWEGHDPTQGMRQGNDVGSQYRSALFATTDEQLDIAKITRDRYQEDDRNRVPRRVLLRRGLPPAVPRQEPGRLLRHRRDRGELPNRTGALTLPSPRPRTRSTAVSRRAGNRSRCRRSPGREWRYREQCHHLRSRCRSG